MMRGDTLIMLRFGGCQLQSVAIWWVDVGVGVTSSIAGIWPQYRRMQFVTGVYT